METTTITGGAVKNAMRSLAVQFMALAEPAALNASVRKIAVTSVLLASAVSAQAQNQKNGTLISEQSAGRWGATVGGAVMGGVFQNATGERVLNQVLTGVATEVGRNGGRIVATAPYESASRSQSANTPANGSTFRPMDARQMDQIDTLALRTAFAYEQYFKAVPQGRMVNSAVHQAALNPLVAQRNLFEMAYRTARGNQQDVSQWSQVAAVFQAPVGTVSISQINAVAAPIAERLYRPGGPGFAQQPQVENMDSLRQRMELLRQQQDAVNRQHQSNPFAQVQ